MTLRPGQIAALVGGVLILISTFVDWFGAGPFGVNAYNGDTFGFTGILLLILSLDIIAIAAIEAFAPQVKLPDRILGFTPNELLLFGGLAAFVWGFSLAFHDLSEAGTLLGALGGIVVVVGAVLEQRTATAPGARTSPA